MQHGLVFMHSRPRPMTYDATTPAPERPGGQRRGLAGDVTQETAAHVCRSSPSPSMTQLSLISAISHPATCSRAPFASAADPNPAKAGGLGMRAACHHIDRATAAPSCDGRHKHSGISEPTGEPIDVGSRWPGEGTPIGAAGRLSHGRKMPYQTDSSLLTEYFIKTGPVLARTLRFASRNPITASIFVLSTGFLGNLRFIIQKYNAGVSQNLVYLV